MGVDQYWPIGSKRFAKVRKLPAYRYPAGDARPASGVKILDFLQPVPNADQFTGEVAKYSLNGITVHTYASKEAYQEWSILFETKDALILLEPQPMPASSKDFRRYIESIGKPLSAVIVSYHGVGPESFPGTPIYAAYLEKLKGAGYEIFLTSHHMPETTADVAAKIIYLKLLKQAATDAKTEPEFIAEMRRLTPGLKGEAYLGITASKLYGKSEPAKGEAAASVASPAPTK